MVETASWKGEQGCKVEESYLLSIIQSILSTPWLSKVDRPGGHAEPEESLKLLSEPERKVMAYVNTEIISTFAIKLSL